jgi:aspartate/tyrosine/aromatic aminotransferase
MFAFTGLTRSQCEALTQRHHVHLTLDGRISMAGLNSAGCVTLAAAINDILRSGIA